MILKFWLKNVSLLNTLLKNQDIRWISYKNRFNFIKTVLIITIVFTYNTHANIYTIILQTFFFYRSQKT